MSWLAAFRSLVAQGESETHEFKHTTAREAFVWLDRTLPLSACFPKGSINREDWSPVPAEALREVAIDAVIHRDLSNANSYVAIAAFDDRIEIHSVRDFPTGIRAEPLTQEHCPIPRNPFPRAQSTVRAPSRLPSMSDRRESWVNLETAVEGFESRECGSAAPSKCSAFPCLLDEKPLTHGHLLFPPPRGRGKGGWGAPSLALPRAAWEGMPSRSRRAFVKFPLKEGYHAIPWFNCRF
ncbi:MAG: hypothetical protein IT186_23790 [Acidobacteria bacterium]|nr:hypothetical protein [Acidobacteriota bacterium]